jgi:hypothetical protein
MADGLHIHIQNRAMKRLAIPLSGMGEMGKMVEAISHMYNVILFRIGTMNPPI